MGSETGAGVREAERGGGRPENVGAMGRASGKSRGNTAHRRLGPRNPLWGFALGQDARCRKMAGQRAGQGGHPKRSQEGDKDGWRDGGKQLR